jgi:uncharacterized protein YuzE
LKKPGSKSSGLLDESTLLDLDRDGNNCSMTIDHAKDRAGIPGFSYGQVTA